MRVDVNKHLFTETDSMFMLRKWTLTATLSKYASISKNRKFNVQCRLSSMGKTAFHSSI